MSNNNISAIFASALKQLIKSAFKILIIAISWGIKICGMVMTKVGEGLDKVIVKKSSL
jgi:hypothetical protein